MRRDLCFGAALCLLVSLLAVVMATEGKTGPGPLAVAMATEQNVIQGPLPQTENDKRLSSPTLGSEYGQRTTGSNSTYSAAGKGHIHVLFSSADQGRHVLKPSVPVSGDGKGQMPTDTSSEMNPSVPVSQDGRGQIPTDTSSEMNPSSIAASPYDPEQDHSSGRLLVAVARTLVTTTASTTTVTVLSTCYNAPAAATPCTGRKKRKRTSFILANSDTGLDSSVESDPELFDKPLARTGRFILWQSSITTIIITTTSTTNMPVVVAAFLCIPTAIASCG